MTFQLDTCINQEHFTKILEALHAKGIPGKIEMTEHQLEVTPPAYADPEAIEILRPVIENLLKDTAKLIKQNKF